jgi:hypothetical protein
MLRFAGFMAVALVVSLSVVTLGQAPQTTTPAGQVQGARGGQTLPPPPAGAAPNAGVGGGGGRGGRGGGGAGTAAAAPVAPTPRWADGKPRLSAEPGQKGLWRGGGNTGGGDIPYQPWARAISDMRRAENLEPHTRCKPSGGPRQFATPYGVEIVDIPDLKRVYIFDVGGPHTFRTIFMDAEHPKDLVPSYYGHSTGKWEGDTLVVDTIGFNDKMWLDRGAAPHTEKLHLIEKFTRTNMNTMTYEITIDDPYAYTAPFTRTSTMTFGAGQELFEYICQDNNLGADLMIGTAQNFTVDRTSVIVP